VSELSTPLRVRAGRRGRLGAGIAAAIQVLALFFLFWRPSVDFAVDARRVQANSGQAYAFALPDPGRFGYLLLGDTNEHPKRSALRLWEDDRPLGPAHSLHDTIRAQGGGAYSHWGSDLYFSASDNSDPRTNGRHYELRSRLGLAPEFRWSLLAVFAAAAAALLWTERLLVSAALSNGKAALVDAPSEAFAIALALAGAAAGAVLVLGEAPAEEAVGRLDRLELPEALAAREWSRSAAPYYWLRATFPKAIFLLGAKDLVSEIHLRRLARAQEVKVLPEANPIDEKLAAELDQAAAVRLGYFARTTMPVELAGFSVGRDRSMIIVAGDRPGTPGQRVAILLRASTIYVAPVAWLDRHTGRE
jgi:hypothetical protein